MKILLVGDFSSAGHFLQKGFRYLGVESTHVAYQNGWRENPIEVNLTSKHKGVIGKIDNYIKPFTLSNLKGFDHVIFLDYFPFPRTFGINSKITRKIQDQNKSSVLWVMGCDSKMYQWGLETGSSLCKSCLQFDQKREICICSSDSTLEDLFLEGISKIIPACFEYHQAHKNDLKISKMIQLPVPLLPAIKNKIGLKLNFFHGLNRYGFKGTSIVESVFSDLNFKYENKANFLIKGKMTFNEYSSLLIKQDAVVDQLHNKSLGINSLLTLSNGKVLIAGDPLPSCNLINAPRPPMLYVDPSVDSLKERIEYALNDSSIFDSFYEEGRDYIVKYHSPEVVASKFLNLL
jgi:glycosyltransferase involved in cell wall biosynthesis